MIRQPRSRCPARSHDLVGDVLRRFAGHAHLGRRIIEIDPPRGFASETVASSVLYTTAYVFEAPISTTQLITGAILGAGTTRGRRAVRWTVAANILVAWVLTIPAAALVAAFIYELVHAIVE